ncbi:sugar phosphate isomerase/epimerase [Gordonia sp. PKS22-38]|uniref:Sugar phosphate isomerase/epimerase n=1 Tax=Gordonia prachuapensis TaxID=3115651 RepID=A0ABU7MVK4_9ACTN|nr:sugar phosphate isomerase/epimerase [Gordonia sp. PKS22-38]
MELALYTDCLSTLSFEEALDVAAGLEMGVVELPVGDRAHLPPDRVAELLDDLAALAELRAQLDTRGLRVHALNCTAWAYQADFGDEFGAVLDSTIRLAEKLSVDKIVTVSGCPGVPPALKAIEWMTVPYPPDYFEALATQWDEGVARWRELVATANAHGVSTIALALHPLALVSNAPTLSRFRDQVGTTIGASIDPATMFWQQMDPVKTIELLGPAVRHVHLGDVEVHDELLATSGAVLTTTPIEEPRQRGWTFRTVGLGRGAEFWSGFFDALRSAGHDDAVSLANSDPYIPQDLGATLASRFIEGLLTPAPTPAAVG